MGLAMGCRNSPTEEFGVLGSLLTEHAPGLLAMVRRRMDPALAARIGAEDVLQDAFLLARTRWRAYQEQPRMTPFAWLYRLTLDCLIEAWRRENRPLRQLKRDLPWPAESALQLGLGLCASGTSPSKALARKEVRARIHLALEALRPRDREVLWMRHFDQLSFQEIGQVLGLKAGNAGVCYLRALERLRTVWTKMHPDGELPP